MEFTVGNLKTIIRSIGRGVVFRASRWDPAAPIAMTFLGDTEGDIVLTPNAAVEKLTLPELSGPAPHEADYTGEAPVLEIPLFLADPTLVALISPSGASSAGRLLRTAAEEHTLVIFPEALFVKAKSRKSLAYTAEGGWTLDGVALTSAQLALLDGALWLWRGFFNRPPRSYKGGAGDARKNIESASFEVMNHNDMPEGQMLYTLGDPADYGIELDPS